MILNEEICVYMEVKDKIFSENNMYKRLKKAAKTEHLENLDLALEYSIKKHRGEMRKANKFNKKAQIPYIIHPLMMACQAHALGIKDDKVLAVTMLHDICEDCNVDPSELPFPQEIRDCVDTLTKRKGQSKEEYFAGIAKDSTAAIVKALDRVNNVSTMSSSFSRQKVIEYIEETEEYVYPLLDVIKYEYHDYNDAVFILKYHLKSLIESIKCFILQDELEDD